MTKWLQEEMCPFCGIPAQLLVLLEENVVWGNPHAKHGEHHFVLRNVEYYRCEDCDEEWFTSSLARSRDEKLNEEIKKKLGIDWLAENRARRKKRTICR